MRTSLPEALDALLTLGMAWTERETTLAVPVYGGVVFYCVYRLTLPLQTSPEGILTPYR